MSAFAKFNIVALEIVFVIFGALPASAQSLSQVSLEGVEKILLQVGNANLKFIGNSEVRRIHLDESQVTVQKDGAVAVIRYKDFDGNAEVTDKAAPLSIEIFGKVQVEVHGRELRIDTQNWQSDIQLQANSLKANLQSGGGYVQASSLKVDWFSNEFKGRVKGDFQTGKVSFKGGTLDGELNLLNGEITCEKATGALAMQSFAAQIKATKCGGSWTVDNLKGGTVAQAWEGRFEGVSQEGPFAVSLGNEGDVNIKTQSGRVTLTPPATASVALNLQSSEGDIVTPNYLKISKEGQKKYLKGRSQGQGEKGSFYVRTQEGVIFVK